MKKLLLSILLLANSLFAITLAEINLGTHPRAMITQVDIRDKFELATKLNTVSYPNWTSSYPYDALKYTGEINSWFYTHDYTNFYYYSSYWDTYLDPNDLSVTYIYIDLAGYSVTNNDITLYKYESGQKGEVLPIVHNGVSYPNYLPDGTWVHVNTNSSSVGSYVVETFIQATDGSVTLGNNVGISRNAQ